VVVDGLPNCKDDRIQNTEFRIQQHLTTMDDI
jgi:hypothetical protein